MKKVSKILERSNAEDRVEAYKELLASEFESSTAHWTWLRTTTLKLNLRKNPLQSSPNHNSYEQSLKTSIPYLCPHQNVQCPPNESLEIFRIRIKRALLSQSIQNPVNGVLQAPLSLFHARPALHYLIISAQEQHSRVDYS